MFFMGVCVGCLGDWPEKAREAKRGPERPIAAQGGPTKPREGQGERGRRRLWHVLVACFIVWVCCLIVSFSGCSLVVGSLWDVSVCLLWVCAGCLRDWSIACGMCR